MSARSQSTESPRRWVLRAAPWSVLLVTVFCFALCCFPLRSMDIWWHLRTGAEILKSGELPRTDWYTYTDAGRPWIDLHWGFQLIVHWLHGLGGTDLLILTKAAIASLSVLLMWRGAGRELPVSRSALIIALVAIVVSGHALVRPGMLSLLALATSLFICQRSEKNPRAILLLIPLQIAWTNVQGLFVLGLLVVILWLADRLLRRWARERFGMLPLQSKSLWREFGIVLAVALACLANPYGLTGALFPLELWKKFSVDRSTYAVVIEFQRPVDFIAEHGWSYAYLLFQAALFILAALSFLPTLLVRRWSPFRLMLFGAFSLLAWKAMRNADLFAITAGWVALSNWSAWRAAAPPQRAGRLSSTAALTALLACCLSLPGGHLFRLAGDGRQLGLGEPPAWFMHGPTEFATRPSMPGGAFVRHIGQAALYSFKAGPGRKVFMDGRLEVASKQTLQRFHQISRLMANSDPAFEPLIQLPNGLQPSILLDAQFSSAQIAGLLQLPQHWRLVFTDASGAVFLQTATAIQLGLPDMSPQQ